MAEKPLRAAGASTASDAMTLSELLNLIANGENSGVEFKRDDIENRALAKELVAFANFRGGVVLLGVEDDSSISGVTRADLEEWVMNACRDKIRPPIIPFYEVVHDARPGLDVAAVSVPMGYTVHSVWHNSHNSYFVRVGTTSREASREELERLFQQRGDFRAELRPVSGAPLDAFDMRRLADYFGRVRQQEVPSEDFRDEWEHLLVNTELMVETEKGPAATVAGLLLFGNNVNRYLPQGGIDAAAYPGLEKEYATTERASLRGPMTPLMGSGGLVQTGLVEQALSFVRRNVAGRVELIEGRRVEHPGFPEDVLREVVVNALVHRDYLLSASDIELSIYEDRLQIISPGRLPNGITPERMRTGTRAARNQLLKDVMRDYGYLEHMGMGIPRTVMRGMRIFNDTSPDLEEMDETFLLRLRR